MDSFDNIGRLVFNTLISLSYWVIAVIGVKDVLKNASNRDKDGVTQALINVAISYGSVFAVKIILDLVKGVMK